MTTLLHPTAGDEDKTPGQPWPVPSEPPNPDGTTPPGDGGHRR